MKPLLALVALTLSALMFEEKARQLAGDAKHAADEALDQGRAAIQKLSENVEHQPLISLLVAGGIAYALASVIPGRG